MSASPSRLRDGAVAALPRARRAQPCGDTPRKGEREGLLTWLDRGLRAGRHGRIAAEYPVALAEARDEDFVVARAEGRIVSHALARRIDVDVLGARVALGMIGLVYTELEHRGRGLAGTCVRGALQRLGAGGATLALLWSDQDAFYERLGFTPIGRETLLRVDARACHALRGSRLEPIDDDALRAEDGAALESLYAAKPVHVVRAPGWPAACARIPDCRIVVARRAARVIAYAAVGRGDDFPAVVHEWAGDPAGVGACLEWLVDERGALSLLAGACEEPVLATLRRAGVRGEERALGLGRVLDAATLARELAAPARASLDTLFVWGFDSI